MGPVRGQSYKEWAESLSPEDVEAILRAHYENEIEHMLDIDAEAQQER